MCSVLKAIGHVVIGVGEWCGIYYRGQPTLVASLAGYQEKWLPLIAFSAHAIINQNSSRLTLKQSFSNPEKEAILEAAYCFPIYEAAAIVEYTCKIDGRVIRGVVRDKDNALKIYETAKEQGQQPALMLYGTPGVWNTRISNIPPLGKVEVEITVICELKHDSQVDGIRFTLPTNVAPRYDDEPENLPSSISPESRGFDITCAVTTTYPITSLQSPSHPISEGTGFHSVNRGTAEEFDLCKGFVTLSQKDTALDKDFVLLIIAADADKPQAILETHPTIPNSRALLLSLVPKFNLTRTKPEIIFIADRSGSMEPQIPQLIITLTVFLKSLPVGVKFNICSFGSQYSFLWPKSKPYDQDNLNAALKHVESFNADVESFDADLGGIEMLEPIEAAFNQRFQDIETEILVLTDGEIWDTEPLFKLVREQCESGAVRLFSLGIGVGVSHSVVEGLARAGRGYAQVIVGIQDKLDEKVDQILKAALGTHVQDYQLVFPDELSQKEDEGFEIVEKEESSNSLNSGKTMSLFDPTADTSARISPEERFSHLPDFEPPTRFQTPYDIPPLYTFSRTNVHVFLSGSEPSPRSVVLRVTTRIGQRFEVEIPVKDVGRGVTVHQLAAKKLLKELLEGGSYLHSGKFGVDPKEESKFSDWIDREGVRVGTTFGLASNWTSFVAVENVADIERRIHEEVFGSPVRIELMRVELEPEQLGSAPDYGNYIYSGKIERWVYGDSSETSFEEYGMSLVESPPTEPDSEGADKISRQTYKLLSLQEFDGSFPKGSGEWADNLTASFKTWISQQHEERGAALRDLNEELLNKLLASAVAIGIFLKDLIGLRKIWEMVVEKANVWGVDTVGEIAWTSLKTWVDTQLALGSTPNNESFWVKKDVPGEEV
ncbi:hypothetical protein R1sor_021776 [Riccia sorocarpa]|uniref:von Willebrand factor type A domain-containing protein n=1 Tax=Riccia sorocarpa TaxID=122646 RepID=A0ABD3GLA7_9MARC